MSGQFYRVGLHARIHKDLRLCTGSCWKLWKLLLKQGPRWWQKLTHTCVTQRRAAVSSISPRQVPKVQYLVQWKSAQIIFTQLHSYI